MDARGQIILKAPLMLGHFVLPGTRTCFSGSCYGIPASVARHFPFASLWCGLLLLSGCSSYSPFFYPALPDKVLRCLREHQEMTLYSLDPTLRPEDPALCATRFHQWDVLGSVKVTSPDARRSIAHLIDEDVAAWDGRPRNCFYPRHGLRISNERGTYDLVICFECQRIEIYSGRRRIAESYLTGSRVPLDDFLLGKGIRLPRD